MYLWVQAVVGQVQEIYTINGSSTDGHFLSISGIALSGNFLFTASDDTTVKQWSATSFTLIRTLRGHTDTINSLVMSPDGLTVFSGSNDQTIRQWNVADGTLVRTLTGHTNAVQRLAASATHVFSTSTDLSIRMWNPTTGALVRTFCCHLATPIALTISSNGFLYSGGTGADRVIRRWDVNTGAALDTFGTHTTDIFSMGMLDNNRIVTGANGGTIRVFNVSNGQQLAAMTNHTSHVWDLMVHPQTSSFYTAGADLTVRRYHMGNYSLLRTFFTTTAARRLTVSSSEIFAGISTGQVNVFGIVGNTNPSRNYNFSPFYTSVFANNASRIFLGTNTGVVEERRADNGALIRTLTGATSSIQEFLIFRNATGSEFLITVGPNIGGYENRVRAWRLSDGVLAWTVSGVNGAACLARNELIFATTTGTVSILNPQNGLVNRTYTIAGTGTALGCNADSFFVGINTQLYQYRIRDGAVGKVYDALPANNNIWAVFTTPTAVFTAAGPRGSDRNVYMWPILGDSTSFDRVFVGHGGVVNDISVIGNFLFTASVDGTIRQYIWSTGDFVRSFSGGHWRPINGISIANQTLFTAAQDGMSKRIFVPELVNPDAPVTLAVNSAFTTTTRLINGIQTVTSSIGGSGDNQAVTASSMLVTIIAAAAGGIFGAIFIGAAVIYGNRAYQTMKENRENRDRRAKDRRLVSGAPLNNVSILTAAAQGLPRSMAPAEHQVTEDADFLDFNKPNKYAPDPIASKAVKADDFDLISAELDGALSTQLTDTATKVDE